MKTDNFISPKRQTILKKLFLSQELLALLSFTLSNTSLSNDFTANQAITFDLSRFTSTV